MEGLQPKHLAKKGLFVGVTFGTILREIGSLGPCFGMRKGLLRAHWTAIQELQSLIPIEDALKLNNNTRELIYRDWL